MAHVTARSGWNIDNYQHLFVSFFLGILNLTDFHQCVGGVQKLTILNVQVLYIKQITTDKNYKLRKSLSIRIKHPIPKWIRVNKIAL